MTPSKLFLFIHQNQLISHVPTYVLSSRIFYKETTRNLEFLLRKYYSWSRVSCFLFLCLCANIGFIILVKHGCGYGGIPYIQSPFPALLSFYSLCSRKCFPNLARRGGGGAKRYDSEKALDSSLSSCSLAATIILRCPLPK